MAGVADRTDLAQFARELADAESRSVEWFRELADAQGSAGALDQDLRNALMVGTVDQAHEQVRVEGERAAQRLRRKEKAAAAERERRRERARSLNSAIIRGAGFSLWVRFWIVLSWGVGAPIIGSFLTTGSWFHFIRPIIFYGNDVGSSGGSLPVTLFTVLWRPLVGLLVLLFVSDLVLGKPPTASRKRVVHGSVALGVAAMLALALGDVYSWTMWSLAPGLIVAGYVWSASSRGVRARIRRGESVSREVARTGGG